MATNLPIIALLGPNQKPFQKKNRIKFFLLLLIITVFLWRFLNRKINSDFFFAMHTHWRKPDLKSDSLKCFLLIPFRHLNQNCTQQTYYPVLLSIYVCLSTNWLGHFNKVHLEISLWPREAKHRGLIKREISLGGVCKAFSRFSLKPNWFSILCQNTFWPSYYSQLLFFCKL